MASLITVRINKGDSPNLGFRLQGGKDFGTPLVIQKVNGGSPAERAGLVAGDSVIKINNTDVFNLRHKDAQDVVVRAGHNFEMTIQRGGSTWRPTVVSTGSFPTPTPSINNISPVTRTSLAANKSENIGAIGTGHNVSAKPFGPQVNGAVNGGPKLVNKQYNSPIKLYSDESIAETLSAQTEVLPTGALGVNFKKNEKNYDASNSAVLRMLKETENEPRSQEEEPDSGIVTSPNSGTAGLRHVQAPENKPQTPNPQLPPGQNICADCERLIVGVFVRIKDKNLHVECFKCSTCGSSLKNVGYYNINNKLYCDIHAKSAALRSNANPNLVPVTVPPGGKAPAHAISSALASHSLPSAPSPLSPKLNNNFAPPYQTSNSSGPKPFSSVSAPLSPHNTLPRAAPLSPVAVSTPHYNTSSYSPASSTGKSIPSIIWPPPQEDKSELPTACPLFYPPPSQVEQKFFKKTESEADLEIDYITEECSELEEIHNNFTEYMSRMERKSSIECVGKIQESLETQKLVENILKTTTTESLEKEKNKATSTCPLSLSQSECCQKMETCEKVKKEEVRSTIENSVPLKWESPLIQNLRTTAPDSDTFSLIPHTKHSSSKLASALLIAPSEPFQPSSKYDEPVPLPEETVPYFPPERPVTPKEEEEHKPKCRFENEKSSERPTPPPVKKKFSKDPYEKYFEDLEKPQEKISMLAALTIASDRPYSPLIETQVEVTDDKDKQRRLKEPKKPEVLPESFQMNKKEPKPPSYYPPSLLYERTEEIKSEECTEETNTSTTKTIEKQTIQNPQVTQVILNEGQDVSSNYPPLFKGFTCSFQNKTDHSQFSVEINTEPPIVTQPKRPTLIQTVESQAQKVIEKEIVTEEKTERQQTVKKQEQSREEIKSNKVEAVRQNEEVIMIRASPQVALRKVENLPSYQVQLGKEAEADLYYLEKRQRAQAKMEQQKAMTTEQETRLHQPTQTPAKPIITIEPDETPSSITPATFKPILDERPPSRTFSPRPGTVTPSMISKPPPVLPYYQANLVPQHMAPVAGNIFDPKSPGVSRSPSPCPGARREPSPIPPQETRTVSPAPGPPSNPLTSSKPLPTPQDFKVDQARDNLTSFIPEYKNKRDLIEKGLQMYTSSVQTASFPAQPTQASFAVQRHQEMGTCFEQETKCLEVEEAQRSAKYVSESSQGVVTKAVEEQSRQAYLEQFKKSQSESTERLGNTQIQRRKIVTEEFERTQKEQNIQIETNVVKKYPFQNVDVSSVEPITLSAGRIATNPSPMTVRFSNNVEQRQIQSELNAFSSAASAASLTERDAENVVNSSCCPNSNLKSDVSKPNSGVGGGRQAGGISVAPRKGRGVLNAGVLAGSRIPLCGSCNMQIRGPFITALGKIWCPNHFICATPSCRKPLQDIGFVEERGQLYCEYCFEQYLAPPCAKCCAKIKGDCLKAIGKNFHPECFNCSYCGKLFGNSPFFLEDGSPYCEADWNELFTTKCFACGFPVEAGDRWVEALNNNYHSQCFNCTMCKKNLEGQSFFAKGGRPYCKNHAR